MVCAVKTFSIYSETPVLEGKDKESENERQSCLCFSIKTSFSVPVRHHTSGHMLIFVYGGGGEVVCVCDIYIYTFISFISA